MLNIKIITPFGLYDSLTAKIVNVRTSDGQRGILPNHLPLVTTLEISKMEIETESERRTYTISGGLFYLDDENNVSILVDTIENVDDIDVERAKIAKEKAEKIISSKGSNHEMMLAEISLKKAINRISNSK